MKRDTTFLLSSWQFILIVATIFFFVEVSELLIIPWIHGTLGLDNEFIDVIIGTAISVPFLWWLVKSRDRSEKELRENEEKFRTIFETVPAGLGLTRLKDGMLIDFNKRISEMFGYTKDELTGKTTQELNFWADPDDRKRMVEQLQSGGFSEGMEVKYRKKNGEISIGMYSAAKLIINNEPHLIISTRDISERKETEKKLKASLERVEEEKAKTESIIAAIGDGVSIQDADFKVLYQNKIHQNIIGDQKGKYCYREYEHRDNICEGCPVNLSFKDGKIHTMERCIIKDEQKLYFEITASPLRDSTGNIIAGIEVGRDITERKRAEEALKSSEEKYRDLFENANDAICIVDSDLKFKDINTKLHEFTGYSKEEILKMSILDLIPREQVPRSQEELKKLREIGNYEKFIGNIITKYGNMISVEVNSSAIIEDGRIVGSRDIIRDITERKKVEDALRRSEMELKESQRVAQVGSWQWIIASDTITWSEGYYRIIGRDPALPPPNYEEHLKMYTDESAARLEAAVSESLKNGIPYELDLELLHPDGSRRFMIARGEAVHDAAGQVVMLRGTLQDITERKRAEEKIEASLKEKEMLLREVHHRVKNNMQIISSLLGLQSGYIEEKKYMEMFRDSQNRINSMSLIHEKLYRSRDFSKIEFNEYIRDLAVGLFQSHGVKAGTIELILNIDNVSLGIDHAIPCGLIINELITNSLKYAFPEDRKGELKVSLRTFNENMVELAVGDNGVGIPYDVDFRKTESLGLRLVTILAEDQLHGKIDLDRSRGTEFKIIFNGVK